MSDVCPPTPGPFRYWDYPKPGPSALSLLGPGRLRNRLKKLVDEGDAVAIREWLDTTEAPEEVKVVLRRGLRGEEVYDAVEVASLRWEDRCGSHTSCIARREDDRLVYEVWQDGDFSGANLTGCRLPDSTDQEA